MRSSIVWLLAFCLFFTACSKDKNKEGEILIRDAPRTEVPDELVGKWLNGTFSMSNWWSYDGKQYEGNPYSSSRAINFSKNGDVEFFQVIKTFNGSCATEAFTYFKGTVEFNDAEGWFTIHPQKGNFRGYYGCASGSNFNRAATLDELKPIKLFWASGPDNNGENTLVTAFRADAPPSEYSYFKETNW
jgi:hypothetical protein